MARPKDEKKDYFYDPVQSSGKYDQATVNAVFILQEMFGYPSTGVADLNFQSSLYEYISSPVKE